MKNIYLSTGLILLCFLIACGSQNSKQKNESRTFKIASYNVRNAKGMDDITNFDRIAKIINEMDADAVAIQELDSATERSNDLVVLDELAKRTSMYASFVGSINYKGGKYGNGILTKKEPLSQKGFKLPGKEENRSLLIVELEDYILCCTHLSLTESDRKESINLIKKHTEKFNSKPVFLAGDLNTKPDSDEIKKLTSTWIPLSDFTKPTFPSDNPDRTIDYILLKPNEMFKTYMIDSRVVNEAIASDHRPIWVEVEIEWQN